MRAIIIGSLLLGACGANSSTLLYRTEGCSPVWKTYIQNATMGWNTGLNKEYLRESEFSFIKVRCLSDIDYKKEIKNTDCHDFTIGCTWVGSKVAFNVDRAEKMRGHKNQLALHEMGHLIGAGHSKSIDDVMFENIILNLPERSLTSGDLKLVPKR